nr:uncharacterized protein LOC109730853 [Microcebus murinus]
MIFCQTWSEVAQKQVGVGSRLPSTGSRRKTAEHRLPELGRRGLPPATHRKWEEDWGAQAPGAGSAWAPACQAPEVGRLRSTGGGRGARPTSDRPGVTDPLSDLPPHKQTLLGWVRPRQPLPGGSAQKLERISDPCRKSYLAGIYPACGQARPTQPSPAALPHPPLLWWGIRTHLEVPSRHPPPPGALESSPEGLRPVTGPQTASQLVPSGKRLLLTAVNRVAGFKWKETDYEDKEGYFKCFMS